MHRKHLKLQVIGIMVIGQKQDFRPGRLFLHQQPPDVGNDAAGIGVIQVMARLQEPLEHIYDQDDVTHNGLRRGFEVAGGSMAHGLAV